MWKLVKACKTIDKKPLRCSAISEPPEGQIFACSWYMVIQYISVWANGWKKNGMFGVEGICDSCFFPHAWAISNHHLHLQFFCLILHGSAVVLPRFVLWDRKCGISYCPGPGKSRARGIGSKSPDKKQTQYIKQYRIWMDLQTLLTHLQAITTLSSFTNIVSARKHDKQNRPTELCHKGCQNTA